MSSPTLTRSILMVALTAVAYLTNTSNASERPHVVIVLADDLGYGSVGPYGADPDLVQTPSIDRLARDGKCLTNACTPSSVCTPTRYALLTGQYYWRSGRSDGKVLGTLDPLIIEDDRPTIASMFRADGYSTAVIGKWHLGYTRNEPVDYRDVLRPGPLELGFDYQFAVPQNHNDAARVYVENDQVWGLRSRKLTPRPGNLGLDAPQRNDPETMGVLTARAVDWIERQPDEIPMFLYFAPVAVHSRITPSAAARGSSGAGHYGDFIHDLDQSVGDIFAALEAKGVVENTLFIFTSDNGGVTRKTRDGHEFRAQQRGLNINGELRGEKGTIWEGGFRVPFIARWPGHIPTGTQSNEIVNIVDVYATLAAMLGHAVPREAVDSHDRSDVLLGEGSRRSSPVVLQSVQGLMAIRDGKWKYMPPSSPHPGKRSPPERILEQYGEKLFDLETDISETTSVAREHPEVVKRLRGFLDEAKARPTRPDLR